MLIQQLTGWTSDQAVNEPVSRPLDLHSGEGVDTKAHSAEARVTHTCLVDTCYPKNYIISYN